MPRHCEVALDRIHMSLNGESTVPRCNACSNKLFPNQKARKGAKRKNFRNGEASVKRCSASPLRGRIRTHPHELPLAIAFIVLRTGTDWLQRPHRRPPKNEQKTRRIPHHRSESFFLLRYNERKRRYPCTPSHKQMFVFFYAESISWTRSRQRGVDFRPSQASGVHF